MGHAPGMVAWPEAAPERQRASLYGAFGELSRRLLAARLDALIFFTAEHWTNYFLDHLSAFCVGRAEHYDGPVEPWLQLPPARVGGDTCLAKALLDACYAQDVEPGFSYEMQLDHGTMIPVHFLTPSLRLPIVPIVINTLAPPYPSARRCLTLGRIAGEVARDWPQRIGFVASGGMSHDPGERQHGRIDADFDRRFLEYMCAADLQSLARYRAEDFAAAGAGAIELLSWITLAGALQRFSGEVIAYEAVAAWATGIGAMSFDIGGQSSRDSFVRQSGRRRA